MNVETLSRETRNLVSRTASDRLVVAEAEMKRAKARKFITEVFDRLWEEGAPDSVAVHLVEELTRSEVEKIKLSDEVKAEGDKTFRVTETLRGYPLMEGIWVPDQHEGRLGRILDGYHRSVVVTEDNYYGQEALARNVRHYDGGLSGIESFSVSPLNDVHLVKDSRKPLFELETPEEIIHGQWNLAERAASINEAGLIDWYLSRNHNEWYMAQGRTHRL